MNHKVTIRGTDLVVNPIGLGTNAVGGQKYYPHITDDDGRKFLNKAIELGVNFWDTAYSYGPKRSEEIIGEVLTLNNARKKTILATKAAHEYIDGRTVYNNSPRFLKQAVKDSLKRLQTDYIDLFYIHYPDEHTPKYEAIGALKDLKDKGLIRAIGVSNFSLDQLKEANKDGYVNVYQGEYNLINQEAQKVIFPYTIKHNISFIPYFPFASGLLAGKYTKKTKFPQGDLRLKKDEFKEESFIKNIKKVEKLKQLAHKKQVEVSQLVLATYFKHEAIDALIPGVKHPEQVTSNLQALNVKLTDKEVKEIKSIFK